jgi:hypothetical protein
MEGILPTDRHGHADELFGVFAMLDHVSRLSNLMKPLQKFCAIDDRVPGVFRELLWQIASPAFDRKIGQQRESGGSKKQFAAKAGARDNAQRTLWLRYGQVK